jgi:hypothetical protein
MKTLEEVRRAKQLFRDEFRPAFVAVGNNLATGIGRDETTGEYTIVANLSTPALKTTLPDTYQGFKVIVEIIGDIVAQ